MRGGFDTTLSVPTQETASDLSKLIQRAYEIGERIVLHRDGKPIAAIVCMNDLIERRRL